MPKIKVLNDVNLLKVVQICLRKQYNTYQLMHADILPTSLLSIQISEVVRL